VTTPSCSSSTCDILVPAALENQITAANAERIRAGRRRGGQRPVTPEADPILHERGVFVIPDILCNAGGVIVSYFEWVQDRVISPVSDELAVVFRPLLPAGLAELLDELGMRTLEVDEEEFETLGANVLAVAPGVVILADGNPHICPSPGRRRLRGPHLRGDGDRAQRQRRPDLPHPADPADRRVNGGC
jgi:hypothetical protein